MRHRWGPEGSDWGFKANQCVRCGMLRIKRFCYNIHWLEYRGKDGQWHDKAPPCEATNAQTTAA